MQSASSITLNGQQILLRNVNRIFLGGFLYLGRGGGGGKEQRKGFVCPLLDIFSFRQGVFFNEKLQI